MKRLLLGVMLSLTAVTVVAQPPATTLAEPPWDVIELRDRAATRWLVLDRERGQPVGGAAVRLDEASTVTDVAGVAVLHGDGVATVALGPASTERTLRSVPNCRPENRALGGASAWAWSVYTPSSVLRPGGTMHLAGWLRRIPGGPDPGVLPPGPTELRWEIRPGNDGSNRSRDVGRPLPHGVVRVDAAGRFELEVRLPPSMGLGWWGFHGYLPDHEVEEEYSGWLWHYFHLEKLGGKAGSRREASGVPPASERRGNVTQPRYVQEDDGEPAWTADLHVTATLENGRLHVVAARPDKTPTTGLVLVLRNGVVASAPLPMPDGQGEASLAFDPAWSPAVAVRVLVPRARTGNSASTAGGPDLQQVLVRIPDVRRLALEIAAPAPTVGRAGNVTISVRDGAGPVAGAEVLVAVVEEGAVAISDPAKESLAMPLPPGLLMRTLLREPTWPRDSVAWRVQKFRLHECGFVSQSRPAFAYAEALPLAFGGPESVAAFHPNLTTDAKGEVHVNVRLPKTPSRWRVLAFAVHGVDRHGEAEASIEISPATPALTPTLKARSR